jgi:hypothetical protein
LEGFPHLAPIQSIERASDEQVTRYCCALATQKISFSIQRRDAIAVALALPSGAIELYPSKPRTTLAPNRLDIAAPANTSRRRIVGERVVG